MKRFLIAFAALLLVVPAYGQMIGSDMRLRHPTFADPAWTRSQLGLAGVATSGNASDLTGVLSPLQLPGSELYASAFGVACDGLSNITSQLNTALASAASAGKAIRLPSGICIVDGATVPSNVTVLGYGRGRTILRRKNAASANSIIAGAGVHDVAFKDMSLDGNAANQTIAADNFIFQGGSYAITLDNIYSYGAKAVSASYGDGVIYSGGADGANGTSSRIINSNFSNNGANGINVASNKNVVIDNFVTSNNGGNGISVSNYVFPPVANVNDNLRITNGTASNNAASGVAVLGFYTGGTPSRPIWGVETPAATHGVISGVTARANGVYGIGWQGNYGIVANNVIGGNGNANGNGGGLLFNAGYSSASGNTIDGNLNYGVDAGGCYSCNLSGNTYISNPQTALNIGGTINTSAGPDTFDNNGVNIAAASVESAGGGSNFEYVSTGLNLKGGSIKLNGSQLGVLLRDGIDQVSVSNYSVSGGAVGNAFLFRGGNSASSVFKVKETGNVDWSNEGLQSPITAGATLTIADVGSTAYVIGSATVSTINTNSQNYYSGKVRYVTATAAGSGYNPASPPTVSFSGGCSSAPAATALVSNAGRFLGALMTNSGSGCSSVPTVTVSGTGTGATAVAQVGIANAEARQVTFQFANAGSTIVGGGNIATRSAFTASAGCQITFNATFGVWQEVSRGC